jgi:HK97 family phage prohead protease
MNLKHRNLPMKIKAIEKDGSFAGYGSAFGVMDSYRDVVMQGAFAKTLGAWAERDALPPILWQHMSTQPIGPFSKMEEDETGLYVEGQLLIDDVPQAKTAYALAKARVIRSMSIGYDIPEGGITFDGKMNLFRLTEIDLWEISLVTFPANVEAVITDVKSIFARGELPTLKQFESFLREAGGISRSRATAIANGGLTKLLNQREAEGTAHSQESEDSIIALIENFKL